MKLADNEDRHKISGNFDFGLVATADMRVTCPWGSHRLRKMLSG